MISFNAEQRKFLFLMFILAASFLFFGILTLVFMGITYTTDVDQIKERGRDALMHLQYVVPRLDTDDLQEYIHSVSHDPETFDYLLVMNPQGVIIAHSNPARRGTTCHKEGIKTAMSTGKVVERLYIRDADNPASPYHGEKIVDILGPYYGRNGHLEGIVNVGISLKTLEHLRDQYFLLALFGLVVWLALTVAIVLLHIRYHNEYKRAAILRASTDNQRILLDTIQTQVWYLVDDHSYGAVNQAHAEFNGARVEDLAFKDMYDILPKAVVEAYRAGNIEVFRTGHRLKTEEWIPHVSGGKRLLSLRRTPRLDRNGTVEYVVCSAEDITERKRTEEELRYRSKLESTVAKASTLLVSFDRVDYTTILQIIGESISASRAYIFQLQKNGQKISDIFEWCAPGIDSQMDMLQNVEPSLFPWWMGQLWRRKNIVITNVNELPPEATAEKEVFQAQHIQSLVTVPICSRGQTLWGSIGFDDTEKSREWSSAEIEAIQIVGKMLSTDLERRASEDILAFEREQLLSIFDSIDEGIYVSDPNTYEMLFVNQTIRNIFQKELVGGICYKELQGLNAPCEFCTNEIILQRKPEPYRWEYYNPTVDRDYAIIDRIITWPDGRDVRFELAIDITERKKAEEALAAKNKELESYLYAASHDLRSPLINIQGFSHRLQQQTAVIKQVLAECQFEAEQQQQIEKITDEDIPKSLQFILASVAKMDRLIKGLLQISRTGREKMIIKKIDMNALVENVLHGFAFQIEGAAAKVTVDDLPACYGDERLLNQLVANLIGNALKYRDVSRPLVITVTASTQLHNVAYSIEDTGIGIAPEHLSKIWDVFYRVDDRASESGDGIGLSLVKRIVDKHKGTIRVESTKGQGSVFFIELHNHSFAE